MHMKLCHSLHTCACKKPRNVCLQSFVLDLTFQSFSVSQSSHSFLSADLGSLMERMLEWAVADNREASAATLPQHTENAVRLLHMVQDFLQAEGLVNPALWTEKVLEEMVTLMDSLMVWYSSGDQWFQLSQLGLRLLLGFMAQDDPEVSG